MGGAARHHARRRPVVGAAARGVRGGAPGDPGARRRGGRRRAGAPDRAGGVPSGLPRADRRGLPGLPRRRPVQPVRRVRDHARVELRPDDAHADGGASPGRDDLHGGQPHVLDPVPHRARPDLRGGRDGEPRRPVGARPGPAGRHPDGARAALPRGVRHQGRHRADAHVAARQLPRRAHQGHGGVRGAADQGGRLLAHPGGDAGVPPGGRVAGHARPRRRGRCWWARSAR